MSSPCPTNDDPRNSGSGFARPFALLDQLPEFSRLPELIVLCHRQFAAEKKIAQRVLVQHAMQGHALGTALEINAVIFRPVTMQLFALAFDHAEAAVVEVVEFFGENLKLGEQIELKSLRQRRHLRRAQLVKDDLEHGVR